MTRNQEGDARSMLGRHRLAAGVIVGSVALYVVCGLLFAHAEHIPAWHGLYCATANAMTEGDCDVSPTAPLAYVVNTIEHLFLVAIGAAWLGVFTSRVSALLVKQHVERSEENIKRHVEARFQHHLGERKDG